MTCDEKVVSINDLSIDHSPAAKQSIYVVALFKLCFCVAMLGTFRTFRWKPRDCDSRS